jgi:hypothetical protein
MQNYAQTPIWSDVMDFLALPALAPSTAGTSSVSSAITIGTAFGTGKGFITLPTDHYYFFAGWAAQTNYDNFGGVFDTTATGVVATLITPTVPNAFLVEINRASSNTYANQQLCQAEICSSGLYSGKQNPYPIIYPASETLSFKFTDITGLLRLAVADDAPVPLSINFWMLGYTIPEGEFQRFMNYHPALQRQFLASGGRF